MKKIATIFKSMISNQAVIDSRKNPWWIALIMAVLAIFLPWIPSLSTGYTANTAAVLTTSMNYEIDKGFKSVLQSNYFQNGITIKADSEGKYYLDYNFDDSMYTVASTAADYENEYNGTNAKELVKSTFTDVKTANDSLEYYKKTTSFSTKLSDLKGSSNDGFDYYYDCISVENTNTITPSEKTSSSTTTTTSTGTVVTYENSGRTTYLQNYYIPELSSTMSNYSQWLSNFASSAILNMSSASSSTSNRYPHSYAIWAKDFVLLAVYPIKSTTSSISVAGSYSGTINDGFKNEQGLEGTKFYTYLAGSETDVTKIYSGKFATYLHEAGRPAYLRSVWVNIGIISAVAAGSILVASLLLFFFHKRRTSIYRDANYFHTLNEACYLALTPSLIAMIVGFFNAQYVFVILVGAVLMRTVFSMSKICPPPTDSGNGSNKPLYQARS